jgi:hypothetical protein
MSRRSDQQTSSPSILRSPALLIAIALVAVTCDVFVMGRTVVPILLPGVMPTGPVGYNGTAIEFPWSFSIDPAGAYDAEFAWAAYFANSVRAGSLPLWNPYQGLGQPQLANYVSAVLAPVNWLTLILPPRWWDLVFLTHWFLGAYFVYLVAGIFGLRRQAAILGAFTVLASGFFAGYLAVRSIIGSVVWFPFLIYATERGLQEPTWKWRHAALAFGTYCLATGGHPAPALIGLVLVVLFIGLRVLQAKDAWRPVVRDVIPSIVFGGLLAAPLWLTFGEYVLHEGLAVRETDNGIFAFPWRALPLTVFPYIYGPLNLDIWAAAYSAIAWCPASVMFLAIVGLSTMRRHQTAGAVALTIVVAAAAAKIYGIPIVNDLGRLPLLNKLSFTYANGFVAVGICVLAAIGFAALEERPPRSWAGPCFGWFAFVAMMAGIAASTLYDHAPVFARDPWRVKYLYVAGGAGLFWAIAFPALLALVKRQPDSRGALLLVAAGGVLLQAVACFPNGSPRGFAIVQAATMLAFVAVSLAATVFARFVRSNAAVPLAVTLAAVVTVACAAIRPRLPDRYDPLTPPSFVEILRAQPNHPRIYPLGGLFFPDFATPYELSSITNLDNLVTIQGGRFVSEFLDPGAHPARFYGMTSARHPGSRDPLVEFWERKRYWDLAGIRYLLAAGRDLNARVVGEAAQTGPPVPRPLSAVVDSKVACPAGGFDSISALLATYARTNPGVVELAILDAAGTVTASASVDAQSLVDNAERSFVLPGRVCTNGDRFVTARLSFRPQAPGSMIAAYHHDGANGKEFIYRVFQMERAEDRLRMIHRDPKGGVEVWENPSAADRAFLAPIVETVPDAATAFARLPAVADLRRKVLIETSGVCPGSEAWPTDREPGRLLSLKLSPNRVVLRYEARTPGVLTVTDAQAQGWRATLGGRETRVLRVDGAFRGVCIEAPGVHDLEFVYRPPYWSAALTLAGVGAIGVVVLGTIPLVRNRR